MTLPLNRCVNVLFSVRLRFLFVVTLLSVVFWSLVFSASGRSGQDAAISAVSEGEFSLARAYAAAVGAESAGANVARLLVELNDAVELLSKARLALEAGDFEESVRLAELAIEAGSGVEHEAHALEVEANDAHVGLVWWIAGGSVLGVSVVFLVSFLGYRIFKRWYYQRLLKMKPRIGEA